MLKTTVCSSFSLEQLDCIWNGGGGVGNSTKLGGNYYW